TDRLHQVATTTLCFSDTALTGAGAASDGGDAGCERGVHAELSLADPPEIVHRHHSPRAAALGEPDERRTQALYRVKMHDFGTMSVQEIAERRLHGGMPPIAFLVVWKTFIGYDPGHRQAVLHPGVHFQRGRTRC